MLDNTPSQSSFSLTGQLLVAMPSLSDPRFSKSVVYICEHSDQGAMGLIVNRPTSISLYDLFKKVDLDVVADLPGQSRVLDGGPVSSDRGFVLHSGSQIWKSSLVVNDRIAMTTSRDILEAVALGVAPDHWLIALGYSGWTGGQLERELVDNAWLTVPATDSLLFDSPPETRFEAVFDAMGVDPSMLSSTVGHA